MTAVRAPEPTAPPTPDRRVAPRSTLVCKGVLFPEEGTPAKVFLSNISLSGVGFRSVKAMMPGSEHKLVVEAGPMTLRTLVRIVRCDRKDEKTWDVGCMFVRSDLAQEQRREAIGPARLKEAVSRNPTRMLTPR